MPQLERHLTHRCVRAPRCGVHLLPNCAFSCHLPMRTFKKKKKTLLQKPSGLGSLMYNFISVHLRCAVSWGVGEERRGAFVCVKSVGWGGAEYRRRRRVVAASLLIPTRAVCVKTRRDRLRQLRDLCGCCVRLNKRKGSAKRLNYCGCSSCRNPPTWHKRRGAAHMW